MTPVVLDAANAVAGRAASVAAKELLKGRQVAVINAGKAVINGDPAYTLALFKAKRSRGDPTKGPFYPRTPDRILRRMVRGMLPYKKPLGKRAFRALRVYIAVPDGLQGAQAVRLPGTAQRKSLTLEQLSHHLQGGASP